MLLPFKALYFVDKIKSNFTRNVIKILLFLYCCRERVAFLLEHGTEKISLKQMCNENSLSMFLWKAGKSIFIRRRDFPLRLQWKFPSVAATSGSIWQNQNSTQSSFSSSWVYDGNATLLLFNFPPVASKFSLQPNTKPIALIRPAKLPVKFAFIVSAIQTFFT